MDIIRLLKSKGKTIILITHKLKEIKAVADRCTVLRRGKTIDTVNVADVTEEQLAELMVGRAVKFEIEKNPLHAGKEVLRLENICIKSTKGRLAVDNLSLNVRAGEILGIAGVDGNGQSELLYGISGMVPLESGRILLNGEDISKLSVRARTQKGIGHIPEDRQKHGLVGAFTVAQNVALKNYYASPYTVHKCILNESEMKRKATALIKDFDIRAGEGAQTIAGSMSGGNQQKVIIAREIDMGGDVIVIAQPTRGLDVGAIEYIRRRILAERDKGEADLFKVAQTIVRYIPAEHVIPYLVILVALGLPLFGCEIAKRRKADLKVVHDAFHALQCFIYLRSFHIINLSYCLSL